MGKTDVMLHFVNMSVWAGFLPHVFSLVIPEKLITSRLMGDPKGMFSQKQKNKWFDVFDVISDLGETNMQILMALDKRLLK
ncbi:hypothetical protein ACN6MT_19455 [Neobacillus niacini]|uniref:hypothetical protein n=1 Tax=Neobacillus niacini TaxID=86668 RepID=UPI003B0188A1